jgi:hypothetical protein
MIATIGFLIILVWVFSVIVYHYKGEVVISPIKGLMLGALYNDDHGEEDVEHTIQILFFIFSLNFIWYTEN